MSSAVLKGMKEGRLGKTAHSIVLVAVCRIERGVRTGRVGSFFPGLVFSQQRQ